MSALPPLRLSPEETGAIGRFLARLREEGFEGEIAPDLASRLVGATDNSLYQRLPEAVIYPRSAEDLNRAARAAGDGALTLTMRGGNTGTNGQSLTSGVVADVARHLDRILDFDPDGGTVTVEPGVVLSRLNAFLKPHGFFFPPTVSTATRATLGGMVATDASGKGSRVYGRTSDYIARMDVVLSDGSDLSVAPLSAEALAEVAAKDDLSGRIHREVHRVVTERAAEIERVFPKMNRGLTGYNLQRVLREDGGFFLAPLLAGSEGTLALTKRLTLRVKRLPRFRRLLVVRYARFDDALRDVGTLLPADPLAIEVLDDRVLATAKTDVAWQALAGVLGGETDRPVEGLSFVEFVGDDAEALEEKLRQARTLLLNSRFDPIDFKAVSDDATIALLWGLREKCVGLLGRPDGRRQGVAFVEDTAVPPESLADYVAEFRAILDGHGLTYGMFGHADVGCLHVRPFLDMTTAHDQALIRPISDAVAALTRKYGGLLWGEHGRGFRGEFSPLFFGEALFAELCRIKETFDPKDIFNRGKLAPAAGYAVDRIDAVPFKGAFDAQVAPDLRDAFLPAISCNGNGACFNREPDMAMCPSYKATKDRRQSPKGRATLIRSWARLKSLPQGSEDKALLGDVTEALKASLDTCLSCKACATQCPIRVDIPSMRSKFLAWYFRDRRRPARDYLIYALEPLLALARAIPGAANLALGNPLTAALLTRLGLVDLPRLRPARLTREAFVNRDWLNTGNAEGRKVAVLQDSFTGSFDGAVVEAAHALLNALGLEARVTKVLDNGKARHVRGFRRGFARTARRTLRAVGEIARHNIPVISLDAATGLMFEQEYRELGDGVPEVLPLEAFLKRWIGEFPARPITDEPAEIISHCTEQAVRPGAAEDWAVVLRHFGVGAKAGKAGCCGMAGLFGHEREHAGLSARIFARNWEAKARGDILATGFSCRCQTERLAGKRPPHPVELLARAVGDAA